jgi:acetyl-CoA C-acetyltransferase
MQDSMIQDGLWDAFNDYHMGMTAENLADRYAIDRQQQDAFAAGSQQKAAAAIEAGRFTQEIVPIVVRQGKQPPQTISDDEQPRRPPRQRSWRNCARRSARKRQRHRRTPLRSTTGAAAVLLMSADKARAWAAGPGPHCQRAVAGVDPAVMGIGPVSACEMALARAGVAAGRGGFN